MISYKNQDKNTCQAFRWSAATNILISLSLACFMASLFLVSLFTTGEDLYGFWVLLLGWLGFLIFQLSWYANMINLLVILILHKHPFTSFLLSLLAFTLASQTFIFTEIPIGISGEKLYIKELGLGFYVWYFAQFLFVVATFVEVLSRRKAKKLTQKKDPT